MFVRVKTHTHTHMQEGQSIMTRKTIFLAIMCYMCFLIVLGFWCCVGQAINIHVHCKVTSVEADGD